jgi:hypothetical protein
MRFLQAATICGIYGWATLGVQAGWITASSGPGLVPMAIAEFGAYLTVIIVFFLGAITASVLVLRRSPF